MCVASMISDHYRLTYPAGSDWTSIRWTEYQELKRKAEEYDRLSNQPDCQMEDKVKWEKMIEDYLVKRGLIHKNG